MLQWTERGWGRSLLVLLFGLVLVAGCGRRTTFSIPDGEATTASLPEPELDSLIAGLSDSDPDVRFFSALTLGRKGTKAREAVPDLTKILADTSENVRASAA